MRTRPSPRDVNAAALFGVLGLLALVSAIGSGNVVLLALATIGGVAAVASLRGYPFDRDW